jgi:phage tail tape-measure protein
MADRRTVPPTPTGTGRGNLTVTAGVANVPARSGGVRAALGAVCRLRLLAGLGVEGWFKEGADVPLGRVLSLASEGRF